MNKQILILNDNLTVFCFPKSYNKLESKCGYDMYLIYRNMKGFRSYKSNINLIQLCSWYFLRLWHIVSISIINNRWRPFGSSFDGLIYTFFSWYIRLRIVVYINCIPVLFFSRTKNKEEDGIEKVYCDCYVPHLPPTSQSLLI